MAVQDTATGAVEQVDIPMRASAGGYYDNLMRMYKLLEIPLHPIRFLFAFSKPATGSTLSLDLVQQAGAVPGSYFVHASNLHQLPPRPLGTSRLTHFFEIVYLIICHFWFSIACFLVAPRNDDSGSNSETLGHYLNRIWLPRRYATRYLMPLMSSVSTCTHAEMLAFPASDIVNYKKHSTGHHHYAVCGGAHQVQDRLALGITDIRLSTRIIAVEPCDSTQTTKLTLQSVDTQATVEESFDQVVLAVSPDVAGRIYKPLSKILAVVPTTPAESSVLTPDPMRYRIVPRKSAKATCGHHSAGTTPPQTITFRTQFGATDGRTEAMHAMPGGAIVSTCPLEGGETKETLRYARFTRTLRTAESRGVVQWLMGESSSSSSSQTSVDWVNGQDNVWLAGAWCWDGMVLLEGCVVSAMRVARGLGVEAPWEAGQ